MNKKKLKLKNKHSMYGFIFISPWIIGLIMFFLYPVLHSLSLGFYKVEMGAQGYTTEFIGINNFIESITVDPNYIRHLSNAILNLFIDVPIVLVFSFFVAVLLRKKFVGSSISKAIFFLPVILGSGVFVMYQNQLAGWQNITIEAMKQEGAQSVQLLQSVNVRRYMLEMGLTPKMVMYITGPVDRLYSVMSASGVQVFIFLAGLHSIPTQIYEAAHIEGATGWETFWKVTFPMISPLILVNSIYSIVDSFISSRNELMNYIYQVAFSKLNFGLSSSMAWIFFVILTVILGITGFAISKKVFYYT